MKRIKMLWNEESGQDLTEYALVLILVVLTAVATMSQLGNALSTAFSKAAENLAT